MARPPKAGFSGTKATKAKAANRASLGGFGLKMMQAIKALGDDAYGAEIEAWLAAARQPVDQGQVYVTGKRLVERGLLSIEQRPNKKRGGNYTVKVYCITRAGEKAMADSVATYDALRLFAEGAARRKD
jgi:DNA-binding PadR family transcriptional regulator